MPEVACEQRLAVDRYLMDYLAVCGGHHDVRRPNGIITAKHRHLLVRDDNARGRPYVLFKASQSPGGSWAPPAEASTERALVAGMPTVRRCSSATDLMGHPVKEPVPLRCVTLSAACHTDKAVGGFPS